MDITIPNKVRVPSEPEMTPWLEARSYVHHSIPSIQEQMGIDPISKLAASIEKLARAIEGMGG